MRRVMNADRAMAAELEQTVNGIAEIQMFNARAVAQQAISQGIRELCFERRRTSVVWMQAMANGSQVFVALSTVVVLLVGIAFTPSFGLTFAGLIVFTGMVPTMFACGAAGPGRLHHLPLGGPERDLDLRVARHPPFGPGLRGRRRARRGPWQPGVRGCDVRIHGGSNRFSTGCPSRSPKARRWPWWAASARVNRRCSTSCCDS